MLKPEPAIAALIKGGKSRYASASLTLNLSVDSEYVVAWNQCSVVALLIHIY